MTAPSAADLASACAFLDAMDDDGRYDFRCVYDRGTPLFARIIATAQALGWGDCERMAVDWRARYEAERAAHAETRAAARDHCAAIRNERAEAAERELAEARAQLASAEESADAVLRYEDRVRLERERDDARTELRLTEDCGERDVCGIAPGCVRHFADEARGAQRQRDALLARVADLRARELEAAEGKARCADPILEAQHRHAARVLCEVVNT